MFKEFLTSLAKEVFDSDRGLWLSTKQHELYPNPHTYATDGKVGGHTPMIRALTYRRKPTIFPGLGSWGES